MKNYKQILFLLIFLGALFLLNTATVVVQAVSTSTAIFDYSNQANMPVINTVTEGDGTISGTGLPGDTVTVNLPDGSQLSVLVDSQGNWSVSLPSGINLVAGQELSATQAPTPQPGVTPNAVASNPAYATVLSKTATVSVPPTINPVTVDDTTISGTYGEAGSAGIGGTILLTFPDGSSASAKVASDGSWSIKVPSNIKLKAGDKLTATQTEPNMVVSSPVSTIVSASSLAQSSPPDFKQIMAGDRTISGTSGKAGTSAVGATISITLPNGTILTTTVDANGNWSLNLPNSVELKAGDKVIASQTIPGMSESEPVETTVVASATTTPAFLLPFTGGRGLGLLVIPALAFILFAGLLLRRKKEGQHD
ncbi:Ig-like domain-containing protein [Lactococcus termiticola]|uniref:Bacterial Ig domain-containing protein n=1 Tax=Lactococcus termiticola TaxID=2169526 RepID=A0A2R5HKY6_9LACT|nr:Ig-like domain-containing protein [Lactococcus termiticola]GBG97381.1 hypothetical protein NtB2_01521 [Lactococcus termiticola]